MKVEVASWNQIATAKLVFLFEQNKLNLVWSKTSSLIREKFAEPHTTYNSYEKLHCVAVSFWRLTVGWHAQTCTSIAYATEHVRINYNITTPSTAMVSWPNWHNSCIMLSGPLESAVNVSVIFIIYYCQRMPFEILCIEIIGKFEFWTVTADFLTNHPST